MLGESSKPLTMPFEGNGPLEFAASQGAASFHPPEEYVPLRLRDGCPPPALLPYRYPWHLIEVNETLPGVAMIVKMNILRIISTIRQMNSARWRMELHFSRRRGEQRSPRSDFQRLYPLRRITNESSEPDRFDTKRMFPPCGFGSRATRQRDRIRAFRPCCNLRTGSSDCSRWRFGRENDPTGLLTIGEARGA